MSTENTLKRHSSFKLVPYCVLTLFVFFGGYEFIERTIFFDANRNVLQLFHIIRGIVGSFILAAVVAWFLLKQQSSLLANSIKTESKSIVFSSESDLELSRLKGHIQWLINMRWLVVSIATVLSIYLSWFTSILPAEMGWPLLSCIFVLASLNMVYGKWPCNGSKLYSCLKSQLYADLLALTVMLHFSGGIENPVFMIYIFHVIISGITLLAKDCYKVTTVAVFLFVALVYTEMKGYLPHYTVGLFPHEVEGEHASLEISYVLSWTLIFSGVLYCTAYFTVLVVNMFKKSQKQFYIAAESAIVERQRLELAVSSSGAGILLLSRSLDHIWKNQQFVDWSCDKLNRTVEDISYRAFEDKILQRVEIDVINSIGKNYYFTLTASPIENNGVNIDQVVVMVHDFTYYKSVEMEMIHASKLAILGHVSAGLAHEIGNPLSSVTTRLQLMVSRSDNEFILDSIRLLKDQVARIGRTVHNISQFSKPIKGEIDQLSIKQVVDEVISVLHFDNRFKGIEIKVYVSESLPTIRVNKDQLFQVFLNLSLNAADAMAGQGQLDINCVEIDDKLFIAFKDSGSGIPDDQIPLLFQPFFSTKKNGTGLGLSISNQIVKSLSGKIIVTTKIGVGSTFAVVLPL